MTSPNLASDCVFVKFWTATLTLRTNIIDFTFDNEIDNGIIEYSIRYVGGHVLYISAMPKRSLRHLLAFIFVDHVDCFSGIAEVCYNFDV